VRTGVTTIFPHEGRPWDEPVYAATHVLNGYGELIGINTIREWGTLDSPIVLTSSLLIGAAYDATVHWIAEHDDVAGEAVMPCVTECDDSYLSAVLTRPISEQDVRAALEQAGEAVAEGCVGAGTGMQAFDFKGGVGTASRITPADLGGHTVGALVLTNHGDRDGLLIDGVRVGEAITDLMPQEHSEGSCIVVVATDAPLLPHQLRRVAERAGMGLARGGSHASNTSGEQFIAFSTANRVPPREAATFTPRAIPDGTAGGERISAVFRATVEATEEAVVNAMFAAETTVGRDGATLHALPVDRTLELLERAGRLA
jgi:D-aminopeptidase